MAWQVRREQVGRLPAVQFLLMKGYRHLAQRPRMASKLRCLLIPLVAAPVSRSLAWPEGMAGTPQWGQLEARHVDGLLLGFRVTRDLVARTLRELDNHQDVTLCAGETLVAASEVACGGRL